MRTKQLILIFSSLLLFLNCSSFKPKANKTRMELLTSDSQKYWDPYYNFKSEKLGKGWLLTKNKKLVEYSYSNDGLRQEINYGDLIWDGFSFKLSDSLIEINDYNDYKFKILKLTKDSMILKDISQISYTYLDSILFIKSNDQVSRIN